MGSIKPVVANRITFDRIDNLSVVAYKILVRELVGNDVVLRELTSIPNPKSVSSIKNKDYFVPNKKGEYILKRNKVLYDSTYPLIVYINGQQLSNALVFYNTSENTVKIDYTEINEWDIVEIEYYFDGIEYIHQTEHKCDYRIDYEIDYSLNTVGNHNLLV